MFQTRVERDERERAFKELTHWLLHGLVDFDFISESLLPAQCPTQKGKQFKVGVMKYDVVIVPNLRTIRSTTLERLERFAKDGGEVIFAGGVPSLVDAKPSKRPQRLARRCHAIPLGRGEILRALEPWRELSVSLLNEDPNDDSPRRLGYPADQTSATLLDGGPADSLLYQMRQDNDGRYLFICNTDKFHARDGARIVIRGRWSVTELDTFTEIGRAHV